MNGNQAIARYFLYPMKRFFHRVPALFAFIYYGKTKRCNLCEKNFRKMYTSRITHRPNSICPSCYSTEATRTLWFYLNDEILGQKSKRRFLYFNPEEPILRKMQQHPISITTASGALFESGNQRWELEGYPFDVILFTHQLQYVPDDLEALKALYSMLRPGGVALVTTIVNPHMDRTYDNPETEEDMDRLSHYYEPGVRRVYSRDLKKRIEKCGFRVSEIDYADLLGEAARNYYSLGNGDREIIYFCKKK
jgi:SAM-dependent methyltransferase